MARFDAATAVDPMEYDFSKYGGPQGVIPEPSQGQIETFFQHVKEISLFIGKVQTEAEKVAKEAQETGDTTTLDQYVESIPEDKIKEYQEKFAPWVYEVTSHDLQVDMLRNLPGRVFSAFFRWLSNELGPKGGRLDSPD